MDNLKETLLESNLLFSGRILKLRLDQVSLPDGRSATREVVEHPGAVAIVPINGQGEIILVRQYRHPVGKILLEIPAGKLDPGESPETCAARELEEETGYTAGDLRPLASIYTTPGFSNEKIHIYLARNLTASVQRPDADEFIQVEAYSPGQIKDFLADGRICDAKTMLGIFLAGI